MAETVSIREAAKMLGISRNAAYNAANDGTLPVIRLGHRLLVPRAALEEMLHNPPGYLLNDVKVGRPRLAPDVRLARIEERHKAQRERAIKAEADRVFEIWNALPPEGKELFLRRMYATDQTLSEA